MLLKITLALIILPAIFSFYIHVRLSNRVKKLYPDIYNTIKSFFFGLIYLYKIKPLRRKNILTDIEISDYLKIITVAHTITYTGILIFVVSNLFFS